MFRVCWGATLKSARLSANSVTGQLRPAHCVAAAAPALAGPGIRRGRDVLLVSVDALRTDTLGPASWTARINAEMRVSAETRILGRRSGPGAP